MARILLLRLDGIGDALVLAPLVAALLNAGHEVGGMFLPINARIYRQDMVRSHILAGLHASTHELVQQLIKLDYEYALIATEKSVAYQIAKAANIPQRIGFWNGWEKPLKSLWLFNTLTTRLLRPLSDSDMTEVESLFRLGNGLHAETEPTRDSSRLLPLVLAEVPEKTGYLLVQITDKWRQYGSIRNIAGLLSEVSLQLGRSLQKNLILIGSTMEYQLIEEISRLTQLPYVSFETPQHWMSEIAAADLLITPDSGAAHAAGTVGTPVLVLSAPKSSAAQRWRWMPWASRALALGFDELGPTPAVVLCQAIDGLLEVG